MPRYRGGCTSPSEPMIEKLKKLFDGFQKTLLNPDALTEKIVEARIRYESHLDNGKEEERLTGTAHVDSVSRYKKALERVRGAWLDLPVEAQEVMADSFPYVGTSYLDEDMLRDLSTAAFPQDKFLPLPSWRKKGLSSHQVWRADLEIIDLLISATNNWQEMHMPDKLTYHKPREDLVRDVADACDEYGVAVSSGDRSPFVKIIEAVLPESTGYRDLIKRALKE